MSISNDIINQARTWLGTPFHHQARLKGKGCDCLGLIVGVVDELGVKDTHGKLLSSYDELNYSKQPDGEYLIQKLQAVLKEVPKEEARAGDLALFVIANNPQHLAFITDHEHGLGMIHCEARTRKVVEHRLDDEWNDRLIKVFRWQA